MKRIILGVLFVVLTFPSGRPSRCAGRRPPNIAFDIPKSDMIRAETAPASRRPAASV